MCAQDKISEYNKQTQGFSPQDIIRFAYKEFGGRVNFASSLGEEDQVITDMVEKSNTPIEVFTLDTGRLFVETYDLIAKTQKRYPSINFKIYYPDTEAVEDMVRNHGINLFYESVENRKLCCGIRKVQPLRRALADVDAWICGLRREQGVTRQDIGNFEWDAGNGKVKVNPLAYWTLKQVRVYVKKYKLDTNPLHKKGFISIGCACCTRAVKKGEDIRAGRWWWESPQQKECGLHSNPKYKGSKTS